MVLLYTCNNKASLIQPSPFHDRLFFHRVCLHWCGGHHLLQAPIPEWLKTIAIVNSGLMMVPVLAFITNIFLTMRGRWNCFIESIPLRFMLFGVVFYFLASLQGTFQAFRDTNMYLHFSQWTVGHAHIALLGGFGFLVFGAIYFVVPRVTGKEIYSNRLTSYHFWFSTLGFISFFSFMTIMGLSRIQAGSRIFRSQQYCCN